MGCGGRGSVGAQADCRAGSPVSDRGASTNDAESAFAKTSADGYQARRSLWREVAAYGKAVWSWHPLLVSSRRRHIAPTGCGYVVNSLTTVTRRIRRRGERGGNR
jgi:hypothetical protein